jgi:hypothetical protein
MILGLLEIFQRKCFLNLTKGVVHMIEVIEIDLDAFEMVLDAGPLAHDHEK